MGLRRKLVSLMKPKSFKQLKKAYAEKGITLAYLNSGKKYALSIIGVPIIAEGVENEPGTCQLTGYYSVYAKEELQAVDEMSELVFEEYKRQYADNETMLAYLTGSLG